MTMSLSGTISSVSGPLTITGALTTSGGIIDTGGITTSSGYSGSGVAGLTVPGNVRVSLAGDGLRVAEGANAKQGTATLSAGSVTVANTSVTANSRIAVHCQTLGTVTVASAFDTTTRVVGTSFTIHASQATDTSVVFWEIFEPG